MKYEILHDDKTNTIYEINEQNFKEKSLENCLGYIGSSSKEKNGLDIIRAFYSDSKAILFDQTNQTIFSQLKHLGVEKFKTKKTKKTIFDDKDFSFMFFTSGSTGDSVGALKTKNHLIKEVEVFTKLVNNYKIKKVIVTVPFIHIYGILVGLLYPLLNDIDIVLKEHYLPFDLIDSIDENSLVVTTPLYIKALNKVNMKKDFSNSLFVSSTAPLDDKDGKYFREKFNTDLIQIFGSTETGGIAYRKNDDQLWTPFDLVEVSTNDKNEMKVKSPFVSDILYENGFKNIDGIMQTFDYIEEYEKQFKIIGRSSKILKIAGKRYSTLQIENILEEQDKIEKALVFVKNDSKEFKSESLDITIETKESFTKKEIINILKTNLSNIKFNIQLHIVDEIPTNQVGKKLYIKS